MQNSNDQIKTVGWREWVRLPELGIKRIKAKIDTGALSSSLHAFDIEVVDRDEVQWVRFKVQPLQGDRARIAEAEVPVVEFRDVRSSNGETTTRPVIRTSVNILGTIYKVDVTLFDRSKMGFRMLIGREALRNRFVVDSAKSYCGGKPKKKLKRKSS